MTRKKMMAGNWKMNKTIGEAVVLCQELSNAYNDSWDGADVVVCPPFIDLKPALTVFDFDKTKIFVGAQNCHFEASGAYTGEISASMLKDLGATYCIVGHSERREYFSETDEMVNAKVKALLAEGLRPILCVGESLSVRDAGDTLEFVCAQLRAGLAGIDIDDMSQVVVAYEPVWAIGTGRTATPEQAQEVCAALRQELEALYDTDVAESTQILYGGSMKPSNVEDLIAQADIDGGLIGGAALNSEDFVYLVKACL